MRTSAIMAGHTARRAHTPCATYKKGAAAGTRDAQKAIFKAMRTIILAGLVCASIPMVAEFIGYHWDREAAFEDARIAKHRAWLAEEEARRLEDLLHID